MKFIMAKVTKLLACEMVPKKGCLSAMHFNLNCGNYITKCFM